MRGWWPREIIRSTLARLPATSGWWARSRSTKKAKPTGLKVERDLRARLERVGTPRSTYKIPFAILNEVKNPVSFVAPELTSMRMRGFFSRQGREGALASRAHRHGV